MQRSAEVETKSLMIFSMNDTYRKLMFLTKKSMDHIKTKYAKVEVLENQWDKLLASIRLQLDESEDSKVEELISHIEDVPDEVREYLLKSYIKQCHQLHAIAFFQWRRMLPDRPKIMSEEELLELLNDRIHFHRSRFETASRQVGIMTERLAGKIKPDLLMKYGLTKPHPEPFNMNSFFTLGIPDPFP
jgi:hypothetical protein